MADCSYSRCIQQRRNIKRELQRWTKNMVYIVGLERIAEDLMGKRKWKLYQDSMQQRNYLQPLNNNVKQQQPTATTTTTTAAAAAANTQHSDDEDTVKVQQQQQQLSTEAACGGGGGAGDGITTPPAPEAAAAAGDEQQPAANGIDGHTHHAGQLEAAAVATVATTVVQAALHDEHDGGSGGEDVYKVKDWSPTSKCLFCVDGKLDEHNNHGALSPRPSDSESSDAASDAETAPTLTPSAATLLGNHHLGGGGVHARRASSASSGGATAGMTALETQMVAMAAAALSGAAGAPNAGAAGAAHLPPSVYYGGPLGPNWLLSQISSLQQAAAVAAAAAASSADDKPMPSGGGGGGEQPLDLSSKAGSGDSTPTDTPRHNPTNRLASLDNKHYINSEFRAKPRMSALGGGGGATGGAGGRRTYTEEELQAALRDIQSGKLGTRRAAVIYGIPRSTLRNKEEEEAAATDMDDKELSGAEEEKEVERALEGPLLSYDDLLASDPLKALLTKQLGGATGVGGAGGGGGASGGGAGGSDDEQQQHHQQQTAAAAHFQALLLRSLISSKVLDGSGFLNEQLKLQLVAAQAQSNGDQRDRPSPSNSVIHRAGGGGGGGSGVKRDRPDSDSETEDSGSNVILKIPSFKPTGSKNGGGGGGGGSIGGDYGGSMASPSVTSDSTSPPIALPLPGRGLYQKDVKDLIAKSISQKFQHDPEPPSASAQQPHAPPTMRNPILDFDLSRSRGRFTPPLGGGISVIKTQGPEGPRPYQHQQHHGPPHGHHHSQPHPNQKTHNNVPTNSTSGGGKGTRPKRGKYRNYDRDSLVEAVRAVQRGEMSVHRAGSYYGVPHSTLEYKVKERHLMRPRKRDPKPNPVDEKIASLKQNDLRNAAAAAAANEKLKAAGIKPGPGKFAPTSPNGIKLPMYDPSLGQMGYNAHPFPFWPHPYPHIPLEYSRGATTATAAFPAASPDQLYASQMIQKLHDESRFINPPPGAPGGPGGANMSKSTRQMAESLLDPAESNGLLDGIIRSSLESGVPGDDKKEDSNTKPQNMSNKTLLDQLCRNSRLGPLTKYTNEHGDSRKRENGDADISGEPTEVEPMEYKPDITTIELSNDSTDARSRNNGAENGKQELHQRPLIYLKQELTKPENLKPEMLVRFRDALTSSDQQRNGGVIDDASASESETHD